MFFNIYMYKTIKMLTMKGGKDARLPLYIYTTKKVSGERNGTR